MTSKYRQTWFVAFPDNDPYNCYSIPGCSWRKAIYHANQIFCTNFKMVRHIYYHPNNINFSVNLDMIIPKERFPTEEEFLEEWLIPLYKIKRKEQGKKI